MKLTIKSSLRKFLFMGLSIGLLGTSSCNKFLDVRPQGELPSDRLLKDAAGFESAIYGVYASMNTENLYGKTLSHEMIEILAQYFDSFQNEYVQQVQTYNYKHTLLETTLYNVWKDMYTNIANANNILISLEKYEGKLEHYKLYRGEALGIRAFMHFDLLRLYTENIKANANASGIPYSTKFSLKPSEFSNAAKVYELIIADLKEAEQLLAADAQYLTSPKVNPPVSFLRDRETHFNLYAVQALLARVYLTKGDLVNAAVYAKKVIDAKKFTLMDKSELALASTNGGLYAKETIFGLYSTSYYTTVRNRFLLQSSFFSYDLRPNMAGIYQNEQVGHDYRWEAFFRLPVAGQGAIRFSKLLDKYQADNQEYLRPEGMISGINLIRLPELYYIMAEALLTSNPQEAMQYFNAVLSSRGLTPLNERNPSLNLTLERITADRYKELIGEGQTFFNMKRLHLNIRNVYNVEVPASNKIYVWPIPFDEQEYNN